MSIHSITTRLNDHGKESFHIDNIAKTKELIKELKEARVEGKKK